VADRTVTGQPARSAAQGAPTAVLTVTVRYFAAARAAAGVTEELLTLTAAGPPTVCTVLETAVDLHGPALARVLARCSYLLDEVAVHGEQTPVAAGQVLDVLPPFAGG